MNELELKDHQKRVINRIGNPNSPGLLLYWNVGSGKTIGSIAAAKSVGGSSDVVVPASLQDNFEKEISKTKVDPKLFNIESYEKFTQNPRITRRDNLIVDEAHRLKDPNSRRSQVIRALSPGYKKVLLLTGTPIQNKPSDIAPLINTITRTPVLPNNSADFNKRYIRTIVNTPSMYERLVEGIKPSVKYDINNKEDFRRRVRGLVDYHNGINPEDYPDRKDLNIEIPMTSSQISLYDYYEKRLPSALKNKIQDQLPPSKQEVAQLNSFLSATRQLSNSTNAFVDEYVHSPKNEKIVEILKKETQPNLVYSNYLDSGLIPLAKRLDSEKINYGLFTGGISKKEKDTLVKKYNSGKLRALLVSSSGGEGLDLKNTGAVHIMEPHWNDPKLEQVIGRAIRYKSHEKAKDKLVEVYKYTSKFPKAAPTLLNDIGLTKQTDRTSADQYLYNMSEEKKNLNDKFLKILQEEGSRRV